MAKTFFVWSAYISFIFVLLLSFIHIQFGYLFILVIPYIAIGVHDLYSTHNVLRNYPFLGHFRYMFEFVRPEIQQYFVQSNLSGRPFNREQRSVVYQRAKEEMDTLPFGTQQNLDASGYEFCLHSLNPKKADESVGRVLVGNEQCKKPYDASRLNISAMSFGALGSTAIEALNWGAEMGNFAQDTGEGGLSSYHLKHGGDIILQIGTGNFGFRNDDGSFSANQFKDKALLDSVKMIEIKLSQGAKPSHGGLLPGAKVNKEIAKIRGIPEGKDCLSPPTHPSFDTPEELMHFITEIRELCGGKPVGFKLCIGIKKEFLSICKAMIKTKVYPDFITIDGAEGGTGAAPLEFSNRLGLPINEALSFVHNSLVGVNLRDKIRLIASGKVATGFDMITKLAIGADMCNAARTMMFSIGCIQSLRCNTNTCPTGIATQDRKRTMAVIPEEKRFRVFNFHNNTIKNFLELLGAMGLDNPEDLEPRHILHRIDGAHFKTYQDIFPLLEKGSLLKNSPHDAFSKDWNLARSEHF